MVAVIAPVAFEPLVATEPVQASDAVQAVALVEDQVRVELPPLVTLAGLALIVTAGAAATGGGEVAFTVTVADWVAVPPAPVHVKTYSDVALSGPVDLEPLVPIDPLQAPEAVHAVAFVEFQASAADCPLVTVIGLGDKATVGLGLAGVPDGVLDGVLACWFVLV